MDRAHDIGLSLPGAQLIRMHPNHKVWLEALKSKYYWKHSVPHAEHEFFSDYGHAFSRCDQIVSTH